MTWQEIVTEQLRRHEGVRATPYLDLAGKITVGIGRNLTDKPLTTDQIMYLFQQDLADATEDAETAVSKPVFDALSDNRRAVLVNLAFNLGVARLQKFKKMLLAVRAARWNEAAVELMDSEAGRTLTSRYQELADLMRQG